MKIPTRAPKPGRAAPASGTVSVLITNRHGQRYRYRAQDVTLNLRQGAVQIIEKEYACFVQFERCNIEVADSHGNALFLLSNGSLSNAGGSDLSIVADFNEVA